MASRAAVESRALWDSPTARLSAVAVSVRDQHTIAFLGDSKGNLHKVDQSLDLSCLLRKYLWYSHSVTLSSLVD